MKELAFVDLHTHTLLSDGELLPSELVQRLAHKGCAGVAITDHVDSSNLGSVASQILRFAEDAARQWEITVIPGVELTHVPPGGIADLVQEARRLGIPWIVVHGETIVEPVARGTNRAAIEARVDLLAHPGLITTDDAMAAADGGVYLEVTTRKGHSLANGWVVQKARETGALLLLDTDTHSPEDILDQAGREAVGAGAGLGPSEVRRLWENAHGVLSRLGTSRKGP